MIGRVKLIALLLVMVLAWPGQVIAIDFKKPPLPSFWFDGSNMRGNFPSSQEICDARREQLAYPYKLYFYPRDNIHWRGYCRAGIDHHTWLYPFYGQKCPAGYSMRNYIDYSWDSDGWGYYGPEQYCELSRCPNNSTLNGDFCTCNSGYIEGADGLSCIPTTRVVESAMCDRADGLKAGNPVYLATGQKIHFEVDYQFEGVAGFAFSRYYRSPLTEGDKILDKAGMGAGWMHNHSTYLRLYPGVGTNWMTLVSPEGYERRFRKAVDSSAWVAEGHADSLELLASGEWLYKRSEDDAVLVFDSHGKLRSESKRSGWQTQYSYTGDGRLEKIIGPFQRQINLAYNDSGMLVGVIPAGQAEINYRYDSKKRLVQAVRPDGVSVSYLYENPTHPHSLTGIVDESGVRQSRYDYDGLGRVISTGLANEIFKFKIDYYPGWAVVLDPLATTRNYHYTFNNGRFLVDSSDSPPADGTHPMRFRELDPQGLMKNEWDYNGQTTNYQWDAARRLPITVTEAQGTVVQRATSTEWHPQWRLPLKITEQGRTTEYTYDERGNRLSQTVTDGTTARTTRWTYNTQSLVATETVPNGATTSYQYDSLGNLTQSTNALGHTHRYTHDGAGRVLTHTDPNGVLITTTYDLRGRMLSASVGGITSTYTYTPSGQLASARFAHGHHITYQYDAAQRLVGWSDNRGAHASYALDPMGNRTSEEIRNAQGHQVWQLARSINSLNRVESTTQAGQTTRHYYDANGDLTHTTNGLGETTTYGLDALRRVKTLTNAANASAALSYNAQDAITQAKDYKGVTTTYGRDAQGNPTQEASPDSGQQSTQYDALGLPRQVTDALGATTTYERDLLGRPTRITYADGASTTLQYDQGTVGHLSSITDASGTTTYERDNLGRVTRKAQTLASGTTRSIAYQYDASGQLSATTYPGGRTLQYQRDATGQISALVWAGQPIVQGITWTPLGQPQGWQWTLPGAATSLPGSRSYNSAGQTTATETTSVQHDAAGRIQTLTQNLWHPADTEPGQSTIAQTPTTWAATYDRAGRLTALTKTSGSGPTQDTTTYQYDPNGNLTSSTRQRAGTTTTRTYRTESGHNKVLGFQQTTRSGTASASTSVTHQFDAAGNLQTDGLRHYHYDSQGRLQSARTGQGEDAPTTRYAHNALGQRVFKTDPLFAAASSGSSKQAEGHPLDDPEPDPGLLQTLLNFFTRLWSPAKSDAEHLGWVYLYDEEGSLLGEYGMGGAASAGQSQFLYLPTAQGPIPMAAEIDSRLYAIHTDHLGTPRRLTQADGQPAWQWAYTPYGDEAPTLGAQRFTNETTNPTTGATNIPPVRFNLRYPGQYFDEESGLHYNWHRSYDPKMGRYTQGDPIGLEGGWNRFAYVGGNPLGLIDPDGLNPKFGRQAENMPLGPGAGGGSFPLPRWNPKPGEFKPAYKANPAHDPKSPE